MRAVIHERYGPPGLLRVGDLPDPQPGPGELLVRVARSSVNRTDAGFLRGKPFVVRFYCGLPRPRRPVLGCEFAGTVAALGPGVEDFALGDRVFGYDDRGGGHAELKVIGATKALARIPDGITFDQAAAGTEAAHYALANLRAANVRLGTRILVHGATGGIGSAAVQLARHAGATIVATSTTRYVELVRSLGADRVIDHETEDFTRCGETFDVVFDAVGKSTFGACRGLLRPGGLYLATDLGPGAQNPLLALLSPLLRITGRRRVLFPLPSDDAGAVAFLAERLGAGDFVPVIDRSYPLDEVAEAFRYVETGQKTGNVVIRVSGPDPAEGGT
ncbi:MAG: NAD(P)-dependent alcohol dehydrogenase [Marmoricola sp.]|nr:NAD(P)-dependent alcohol dehydrogenase [Marmoricola sp.]